MINFSKYIIGMVMLLVMSSTPAISKEYNISLTQNKIADICPDVYADGEINKDREISISLDLGKISVSDSLFGFAIYMQYDVEKWYFMGITKNNTLSEYFERDHVVVEQQSGNHIMGNVGTINNLFNPSVGDKPLIKLRFRYLGDCPDTTMFVIEELSFTEECKIPYFLNDTAYVYSGVPEGENRFASVQYEELNKTFPQEGNLSNSLVFDLPTIARVDNFEITLEKNEAFAYSNFIAADALEIENVVDNEDDVVLTINKLTESDQYFVKYEMERKSDEDFSHIVHAKITSLNECNCAKEISNAEQNINYTKSSVADHDELNLCKIRDGFIEMNVPNSTVEIYDLQGNSSEYLNPDIISFDSKVNGLYFVIIKAQNKIETIKYLNIK